MELNRGSEWRKWDLHFHTPSSYDYSKNKSITNQEIVDKLIENNIAVVAITDHHIIDIERIKELQTLSKDKITILPGIEFLSDARGKQPIHFIGIFSEKCNLEHVWGQIENKTKINEIKGKGININAVYCDLDDTISLIHELGGIVTIHAGQKHSSIENITHSLEHSLAQKTDIANKVDFYELGKVGDQNGYKNVVFPFIKKYIPMIICSDNHNINEYKLKEKCWIKANPTFDGLKQVINEPEERIYIGEEPEVLERVRNNRTKYIKSLKIDKIDGYNSSKGKWFDNINIELNHELVAIIGNKGSGKSALSDIIALLGNSYNIEHFSFLHKNKFKRKKLAENFKATLEYHSNEKLSDCLMSEGDKNIVERVRYLPQNYFEELCNDLKGEGFESALERVVFSHLEDKDKLGTNNFNELIKFKTDSIDKDINNIIPKIDTLNREIIDLEKQKLDSYKKKIESEYQLKYTELKQHIKNKPEKINNPIPNETNKAQQTLLKEITKEQKQLKQKEESLEKNKQTINITSIEVNELKTLKDDFYRIIKTMNDFKIEKEEILKKYSLEFDSLIKINTDIEIIDKLIKKKVINIDSIKKSNNDEENKNGLIIDINKLKKLIDLKQKELSEPEQNYRRYIDELKNWKSQSKLIIGHKNTNDTIKYYQSTLNYLKNYLQIDLNNKREERINLSLNIYNKKFEIVKIFKSLKTTIDKRLDKYKSSLKNYNILIDATFKLENFDNDFLRFIQQNKIGSFRGSGEGKIKLNEIIENKSLDNPDEFKQMLELFMEYLEYDKREDKNNEPRDIFEQVTNIQKFYDMLFSLEYLKPNYELKLDNKSLMELSPGEKGALLLVFYLILDKEDIPLIIDQPEDNLDNQSVYKIVVQFIKNAKKRRQIIMVTHNPNLAVVSDAEQIIYANIDKQDENKFTFKSGAIEDAKINKCILNILEGTRPAFENRSKKYFMDNPK